MNKSAIKDNLWKIEKRSKEQYNDFDEYIIKNSMGNIVAKIPNDRDIADWIVDSHNEALLNVLCE